MKSSNLAWRIEWFDEPPEPAAQSASEPAADWPRAETPPSYRAIPRFERRTIEIRDRGFEPFRVR